MGQSGYLQTRKFLELLLDMKKTESGPKQAYDWFREHPYICILAIYEKYFNLITTPKFESVIPGSRTYKIVLWLTVNVLQGDSRWLAMYFLLMTQTAYHRCVGHRFHSPPRSSLSLPEWSGVSLRLPALCGTLDESSAANVVVCKWDTYRRQLHVVLEETAWRLETTWRSFGCFLGIDESRRVQWSYLSYRAIDFGRFAGKI